MSSRGTPTNKKNIRQCSIVVPLWQKYQKKSLINPFLTEKQDYKCIKHQNYQKQRFRMLLNTLKHSKTLKNTQKHSKTAKS